MRSGDEVIVLDFGSQYGQLIARRVREAGVYCEILPSSASWDEVSARKARGIILSGGPASVYKQGAPNCDPRFFRQADIPVLGICYGMQLMAKEMGGDVRPGVAREYGKAALHVAEKDGLLAGVDEGTQVWMSHGDLVEEPPPGFRALALTDNTPVAAMAAADRPFYALQFHPEVEHTPQGRQILDNFIFRVCGLEPTWTPASFIEETVAATAAQVGEEKAICALSGGVDSAVAAALVSRAIGDRLTCIFVDHGLMRHREAEEVTAAFRRQGFTLRAVDASDRFLSLLAGVVEPEQKRRIIGREFIRVFEEEAAKVGEARFLVQGTLYPDVIESGPGQAAVIKSHHNVGGLPEDLAFTLVEPLRELFKDEVRRVGLELGLPPELVWRQPFPGPGLAIRIIGEVTPEAVDRLRQADRIVREEIGGAGLNQEIWQYFAVLLGNTRSVGVMGDERTYGHTVVLRAVTSSDGMTADWARIPHPVLESISNRVINEVSGVNRVAYDITSKPPGTIEWE